MKPYTLRSLLFMAWIVAIPCSAIVTSAAQITAPVNAEKLSDVDPQSGIEITMLPLLGDVPPLGAWPVRITIRNDSDKDHTWTFQCTSYPYYYDKRSSCRSYRDLTVEARATRTFDVYVPLAQQMLNRGYSGVDIDVIGYGMRGAEYRRVGNYGYSGGSIRSAYVALSESLTVANWESLNEFLGSNRVSLAGTRFNPSAAPLDSIGWTGVDAIWLTREEWDAMEPAARGAITDWVNLGGRLFLCAKSHGREEDAPYTRSGFGIIRTVYAAGLPDIEPVAFQHQLTVNSQNLRDTLDSARSFDNPLRGDLGEIVVNRTLILIFVFMFAFLVGPLNLFVLAKRRQHKLIFITTPLLSIAASVGLTVMIILQDGTGGEGRRTTFIYVDPASHKSYTVQEQISLTGLLLNRSFPVSQRFLMAEMEVDTRKSNASKGRNRQYDVADNRLAGDWFVSRSVQGHYLAQVKPGRDRVEVSSPREGRPPEIVCGLNTDVREIFYCDAAGRYWRAIGLRTGERREMEPSDPGTFVNFWTQLKNPTDKRVRQLVDGISARPGFFYAAGEQAENHAIPTLPSIRWRQASLGFFGPAVTEGSAP